MTYHGFHTSFTPKHKKNTYAHMEFNDTFMYGVEIQIMQRDLEFVS